MADGGTAQLAPKSRAALRYHVEGMDCPSCASKIETAVGRFGGAEDIQQFEALEEHDADTTWCRGSRRHVAHPRTGRQHRVLNAGFGGG